MKRTVSKETISYRLNETLFQEAEESDPMAWAQRLHFPIVGFRHAIVGPDWSTGKLVESDYLHHINFVVGGAARLWQEGRAFDLKPGFAYWLPGNWPNQRECAEMYGDVLFDVPMRMVFRRGFPVGLGRSGPQGAWPLGPGPMDSGLDCATELKCVHAVVSVADSMDCGRGARSA